MTETFLVNAFSNSESGGNPAGIVLDASSLSDEQMQSIAADLGYSETAFVTPSDQADFRVRFFTPKAEVDLCGHATIATFFLLKKRGQIGLGNYTQETKAGVLGIEIADEQTVFMEQTKPAFSQFIDSKSLAPSLNITENDFDSKPGAQIVSTGLRDVLIPICDLDTLNRIQPDFDAVSDVSKKLDVVGYHLFAIEEGNGFTAHCRNLAPLYDIPEESATGTSSGALACYLFAHGLIQEAACDDIRFSQGQAINRPSEIRVRLAIKNKQIETVKVGGTACVVG